MLWLNPSALFALAVVAAPVLIHLLIQRRAERFAFPTLKFLQPTRLAAIRRHLLEDLLLLAVRAALLAAAVAALAGPLFVTSARKQAWDRRVVRAVVTDRVGAELARPQNAVRETADQGRPLRQETFQSVSLADGIRRAMLWLESAPPARREIAIESPLAIGSITDADIAAIRLDIGVRFERTGALPPTRTAPAGHVLTSAGVRAREITFAGAETAVREAATGDPIALPIDVVASAADRRAVDAAVAAVLSQRVWAAPADHRARLVLADLAEGGQPVSQASPKRSGGDGSPAALMRHPWMADAVERISRDADVQAAGARVAAGLTDAQFASSPWETLVSAADGRPLAAASAAGNVFLVVTAAPATDIALPVLLRSIANALAPPLDLQRVEVVPIADAVLQRWSRPAGPVTSPRIETVDADDRRWLWLVALLLIAAEMWIRRAPASDAVQQRQVEDARVA